MAVTSPGYKFSNLTPVKTYYSGVKEIGKWDKNQQNIASDLIQSFVNLVAHLAKEGFPRLVLTGMFRTPKMQEDLKKRKPTLAAKPGTSWHEAGRAMDVDLEETIGLSLLPRAQKSIAYKKFVALMSGHGWEKLSAVNEPTDPEAWHFQHPNYTDPKTGKTKRLTVKQAIDMVRTKA